MSCILDLKTRTINLNTLNEDCNYVLQSCNINENTKYQNVILSILNYIIWEPEKLRILAQHDMIDWNIYSSNDLSIEVITEFINRINFGVFLDFIETKYKIVPTDGILKLKVFSHVMENQTILRAHAIANPSFYYTENFLKEFKFALNTLDIDLCKRYICSEVLVNEFFIYCSPILLEHFVRSVKLNETTVKKIADMFKSNLLEYDRIWGIIFEFQLFSFQSILHGAISNAWSYNTWISILKHQNLNEDELLNLFKTSAGKTIMQLACEHKSLSEDFLETYWDSLNIPIILKHQKLSYKFVKTHPDINFALLATNETVDFKVIDFRETNNDSLIESPIKYVVLNEPQNKSNILFID